MINCTHCKGLGYIYRQFGEDDFEKEVCEECMGQGAVGIGFFKDAPWQNKNCYTNTQHCINCNRDLSSYLQDLFVDICPYCNFNFKSIQ